VSSTARLLSFIPQGTGTCGVCNDPVTPYEFRGHVHIPILCPECHKEEQLEADKEAQRKAQRSLVAQQSFRPGFEEFTFDAYRPNGNRRAYDRCRLYVDTFRAAGGRGLALQGGVGLGKTHLGVSVARCVPGAYVINTVELLDEIRKSFAPDGQPTKTYQKCCEAPLLVLDDMGKAKPTEWVLERLYQLVNYRIENQLPIILTTNDDPQAWDARWTPAIADRIRGACDLIEFTGLSYRSCNR